MIVIKSRKFITLISLILISQNVHAANNSNDFREIVSANSEVVTESNSKQTVKSTSETVTYRGNGNPRNQDIRKKTYKISANKTKHLPKSKTKNALAKNALAKNAVAKNIWTRNAVAKNANTGPSNPKKKQNLRFQIGAALQKKNYKFVAMPDASNSPITKSRDDEFTEIQFADNVKPEDQNKKWTTIEDGGNLENSVLEGFSTAQESKIKQPSPAIEVTTTEVKQTDFPLDFVRSKHDDEDGLAAKKNGDNRFLQIELTQSDCEKLTGGESFRYDSIHQNPYYHKTIITIFRQKIIAEQFSKHVRGNVDVLLLPIKDGNHVLTKYHNGSSISFTAKNGIVSNLKMSGSIVEMVVQASGCDLSEAIYKFYQLYDKDGIVEIASTFKDLENFNGLTEFSLFVEKADQTSIHAIMKKENERIRSLKRIKLCNIPGDNSYIVKPITYDRCLAKQTSITTNASSPNNPIPNPQDSAFPLDNMPIEQTNDNYDYDLEKWCQKYENCSDYVVIDRCAVILPNPLVESAIDEALR